MNLWPLILLMKEESELHTVNLEMKESQSPWRWIVELMMYR